VLVLARSEGETIMIGHDIKVTVVHVSDDVVRIGIEAPSEVTVHREEIYLTIRQANVQAADSTSELQGR
jgi:carbon storage regulator